MERTARISEIFLSIEGEGPLTGRPTLFVRFFGCNFTCSGFNNPSGEVIVYQKEQLADKFQYTKGCDSAYSWHPAFKEQATFYTADELVNALKAYVYDSRNPPILCFTGGEPLLYQEFITEVIEHSGNRFHGVLFESNGSIVPSDALVNALSDFHGHIYWSFSPKLSESGEPWNKAINPSTYAGLDSFSHVYLKFVSNGSTESFAEIEKAVTEINSYLVDNEQEYGTYLFDPSDIWIMPVGTTKQQQEEIQRKVAEEAIKRGYNFCMRTHVFIFDNEIGT